MIRVLDLVTFPWNSILTLRGKSGPSLVHALCQPTSINTMADSSYGSGTQRAVVAHTLSSRIRRGRRNVGLVTRSVACYPSSCPGLSNTGPSAVQLVW